MLKIFPCIIGIYSIYKISIILQELNDIKKKINIIDKKLNKIYLKNNNQHNNLTNIVILNKDADDPNDPNDISDKNNYTQQISSTCIKLTSPVQKNKVFCCYDNENNENHQKDNTDSVKGEIMIRDDNISIKNEILSCKNNDQNHSIITIDINMDDLSYEYISNDEILKAKSV